ncbi:LysE family translocator [Leucobacter musarum]|uniref:LysE family translocator n=1 Tax=Leucobacter musarum TaxID=1930747 RepID=UPI0006A7ED0B|nr:LysE family translocator [Leucobacter musarum]
MTLTQALIGFAAVAVVLTVIPGIDTTLVLRASLTRGVRHAVSTALGIGLGALIWGAAAALGATALLAASRTAYLVVAAAGTAYLLYLGVNLIVQSLRSGSHTAFTADAPTAVSPWRSFAAGITTNLLNPKVGVFYIATIPQFIPAGMPALEGGLLLAGVHVAISLAWFALIIGAASVARRWLANARAIRIVDRVAGSFLVLFGIKLAFDTRSKFLA